MASEARYRGSAEWLDIVPVPQDDGPDPPAAIAYTAEYTEAMDYFRGVLAVHDKSARVLRLTEHIVTLNPGHYSVWQYRREVLAALGTNLHAELKYVGDLLLDTPKNYQLWYHRQVLVERLNDASGEVEFLREVFEGDAKNYHAWAYRQWLLLHFAHLWAGELAYVEELLSQDVRNNSAWNQRFYCITHQPGRVVGAAGTGDNVLQEELRYVFGKLERTPNNESAWNYLRGLVDLRSFAALPEVERFCVELRGRGVVTSFLFGMLVDICEAKGDKAQAAELLAFLADKLDPIRRKYWLHRRAVLEQAC